MRLAKGVIIPISVMPIGHIKTTILLLRLVPR